MFRSLVKPAYAGRRGWVACGLLAGLVAASQLTVAAQEPAPAPQAEAQKSPFAYSGNAAVFIITVKPDRTADFEMVMARVKEALMKSENPQRKEQAAGWKVFKAVEAPPNGVIYMLVTDPVVAGTDYSLQQILIEGFGPTEGYEFAKTLADTSTGATQLFNLNLTTDFGQ